MVTICAQVLSEDEIGDELSLAIICCSFGQKEHVELTNFDHLELKYYAVVGDLLHKTRQDLFRFKVLRNVSSPISLRADATTTTASTSASSGLWRATRPLSLESGPTAVSYSSGKLLGLVVGYFHYEL